MSTLVVVIVACATAPDPPPRPTVRSCPVETKLLERFEALAARKFDQRTRPDVPAPHGKICSHDRQCERGAFCVAVHGLPRRVCRKASRRPNITTSLHPHDR